MVTKTLPSRDLLWKLLDYAPASGEFTWRLRPREMFRNEQNFRLWNTRYAGKPAGTVRPAGHLAIAVGHTQFRAHRLAWLYVRGEPVPDVIDHADGDKLNNRIANLRAATKLQNGANSGMRVNNIIGVKGVSPNGFGRFRARLMYRGKEVHLGTFDTVVEAAQARRDAALRLHGEFARHD